MQTWIGFLMRICLHALTVLLLLNFLFFLLLVQPLMASHFSFHFLPPLFTIFCPFCLSVSFPLLLFLSLLSVSSVHLWPVVFPHITFGCLFPLLLVALSLYPSFLSSPLLFLLHFPSSFYCFKLLVQFSSRAVVGLKAAR